MAFIRHEERAKRWLNSTGCWSENSEIERRVISYFFNFYSGSFPDPVVGLMYLALKESQTNPPDRTFRDLLIRIKREGAEYIRVRDKTYYAPCFGAYRELTGIQFFPEKILATLETDEDLNAFAYGLLTLFEVQRFDISLIAPLQQIKKCSHDFVDRYFPFEMTSPAIPKKIMLGDIKENEAQ